MICFDDNIFSVWEHVAMPPQAMSSCPFSIHWRPGPLAQRCLIPSLSLHLAVPPQENYRTPIARQQNCSLSPRARLHLQVPISCSKRDVIGCFCIVAAESVGSDGTGPNSNQKLGSISDDHKDRLQSFCHLNKITSACWFQACHQRPIMHLQLNINAEL